VGIAGRVEYFLMVSGQQHLPSSSGTASAALARAALARCRRSTQPRRKVVHPGCGALSDCFRDRNSHSDFLLIGPGPAGFCYMILKAGLAVGGYRCSNGNQFLG
jgi:hypothetical protein